MKSRKVDLGGTGTIRLNRIEDCPLKSVPAMKKTVRGSYNYKLDSHNNIIVVRRNDNSIVTLASNITGVQPLQKAKRWDRVERKKIEITQPAMVKSTTNIWVLLIGWILMLQLIAQMFVWKIDGGGGVYSCGSKCLLSI